MVVVLAATATLMTLADTLERPMRDHSTERRAVVSPLCPVRTADGVECGGDTDAWAKPEAPPAAVTVHCKACGAEVVVTQKAVL